MAGRTVAGRYLLEQPLGGGAMSSVWRARDPELDRNVAVKLLAPAADRARFAREARAVAGLAHPHICQLYDYGEAEQGPYMILEYLSGGTLEDRLARGQPLPDDEAARVAADVSGALAYAHQHGVVHRDLKPANILFDAEGRAKIADWGIARIAGGEALTKAGTIMGTAAYISPEQGEGREATAASDVYSFGAILYRMLTGRPPFTADSALELVRMHREELPAPIHEVRPGAPPELAALAERALAKDPARRPRDGAALAAALSGADTAATTVLAPSAAAAAGLLDDAVNAPPTQVIPRRRPARRNRRRVAIAAIALIALVAAGIAAAVVLTQDGTSSAPPPSGSITLPNVSSQGTSTALTATTLAQTTAAETTTAATTTAATTTSSTARTTTSAPTTTPTSTTLPATTAPPPPTISTILSTSTDISSTTTVPDTTTGP